MLSSIVSEMVADNNLIVNSYRKMNEKFNSQQNLLQTIKSLDIENS